jgi:hypothetical protein
LASQRVGIYVLKLGLDHIKISDAPTRSFCTTDTNVIRDMLLAQDYLPLAIVGAAAYMQTTGTRPTEYLEMFNSTRTYQANC